MDINQLTGLILSKAYEVHTVLGPGLLESAYEECLCHEFIGCGLQVERQKTLPIIYKETKVDAGYRLDIVVNNCVILELKSIESLTPHSYSSTYHLLKTFNYQVWSSHKLQCNKFEEWNKTNYCLTLKNSVELCVTLW